jgi:hypothetical protein
MPIKLANNASAHLAAPLDADGTTIVLVNAEIMNFPALAPGEWFPLTLADPDGNIEITRVTERSGNILTALRAQEGTTARAWTAGDRAEIRLTASIVAQLQSDTAQAKAAANSYTDARETAVRTDLATALASESGARTSAINALDGAKFDKTGGAVSGNVTASGTVSGATVASTGAMTVGGNAVWHAGNFTPANYLPLSGGTITNGVLTISHSTPYVDLYDQQWGSRKVYHDGGLVGFLTSGGGWACYSQNDGTFVASGNIGAYSDRRHKTEIETIGDALALVEQLRGVRYTRIQDGVRCVGVIAQEVQEAVPEVVGQSADGLYVDYGNLVAPLIEAVKELSGRVRQLEDR